jgi:hypothetical protein
MLPAFCDPLRDALPQLTGIQVDVTPRNSRRVAQLMDRQRGVMKLQHHARPSVVPQVTSCM